MKITCPKCLSTSAILVLDDMNTYKDVTLKCTCGFHRVVQTTLETGIFVEHIEMVDKIGLPKKGSKLMGCLAGLYNLKRATKKALTEKLSVKYESSLVDEDVVALLTTLQYRGLVGVERLGSTQDSWEWFPTETAMNLIQMKEM